jgi:SAM-dependent methyltransferase
VSVRDRLLYGGRGLECPCCGGRFRRFRSAGTPSRANARCPRCDSLERHRQHWLWLTRRSGLFGRPQRLLHVAPERILLDHLQAESGIDYVPVDKHEPGHSMPPGVGYADLTALDFPDASFDAILCFHVLEHIPEDRLAMRELRRVLRPDGWALVEVPFECGRETTFEDPAARTPEERLRAFGQIDHVRIYGRDFVERLEGAGFDVAAVAPESFCTPEEIARYSLTPGRIAFLCRPVSGT